MVLPDLSRSFPSGMAVSSPRAQLLETYCVWSLARMFMLGKVQPPLPAHLLLLLFLWFGVEVLLRLKVTTAILSGPSPSWSLSSKDRVTWPHWTLGRQRPISAISVSVKAEMGINWRPRRQGQTLLFVARAWEQESRASSTAGFLCEPT